MGMLARLRGRLTPPPRSAVSMVGSGPARGFSGDVLGFEQFPWWAQGDSGFDFSLTRKRALAVPAVLKGRNLICGTISSLPLLSTDAELRPSRVPLLEQIDPDVVNSVTMAQTIEDLVFDAISWWRVTARDGRDYPVSARHIDPINVSWQMPSEWPLNRLPSGYYPGSHAWVQGEIVEARNLIRFDSPHPGLLESGAPTIRRALMYELAADNYARNPQAREYFATTEDAAPDDTPDEDGRTPTEIMLDSWIAARQLRTTGFVPAGYELHQVEQLSPADLQLIQQIDKATRDIANMLSLDPEDLGVSTTSRTYQNAVDRRIDKVNECYAPYATAIAERLSMGDVTRRGQQVRFAWSGFLKANPTDLALIHQTYVDMGALIDDEVRADIGRPVYTAEQRAARTPAPVAPRKPLHENTDAPAPAGPGIASVTQIGTRAAATHSGLAPAATFAADDPADPPYLVFDVSDVAESFSVNEAKRTITGLVVPWGKVGRSRGRRWKFAPDALVYDKSKVNRLKLIDEHTQSAILGRTEKAWSDTQGQWATYKVARGPEGDRALAQAADGIKDGLSVGIGYDVAGGIMSPESGVVFGVDPAGEDCLYVVSAPWRETSHVAIPAFDDARISAVTMSAIPHQTEGPPMKCTTCGQEHAPGIACPQAPAPTLTADLGKAVADAIAAGFAANKPTDPAPVVPVVPADFDTMLTAVVAAAFAKFEAENGPTFVNPVRPGDLTKVTEKPLYRFDGKPGQRNLTSDIANGFGGDDELKKKAGDFIAEQMGAAFANISVANVGTLNPTIQRPDLWVPSLHFTRSLGGMVQGGVVDSVTAQRLPKFSTAAGLAGTHTEGTEPTDGSFTTTSQDVTPKAISGRVTIDREVVDQGGTPQTDQLIWNEMTQFYAELLETRLVAMFVALGLSDTAVIGTDTDLQAALSALFAALQFVKGGDRYRGLGLNQDLYTAITGAVDMNGRPLFPMLNPTNSIGTVATDWSNVRVGSKIGTPAWALASGNAGPDKSFLFVPESVYQWFSPPRRIDLDRVAVATVGIGIWGYSAEFTSRNADVKQLAWTPS